MFNVLIALLIAGSGHGHHGIPHHPHAHHHHHHYIHKTTLVTCTVNRGCTTQVIGYPR